MSRWQTAGFAVTLLAVGALLVSGLMGIGGKPAPAVAARTSGVVAEPPAQRVRVEVLNASGRLGLAREATRFLRDRGFDVVSFGTARGGVAATRVIDRIGKPASAQEVADALGLRTPVTTERDTTLFVDATVVLGKDWHPAGDPATTDSVKPQ